MQIGHEFMLDLKKRLGMTAYANLVKEVQRTFHDDDPFQAFWNELERKQAPAVTAFLQRSGKATSRIQGEQRIAGTCQDSGVPSRRLGQQRHTGGDSIGDKQMRRGGDPQSASRHPIPPARYR